MTIGSCQTSRGISGRGSIDAMAETHQPFAATEQAIDLGLNAALHALPSRSSFTQVAIAHALG